MHIYISMFFYYFHYHCLLSMLFIYLVFQHFNAFSSSFLSTLYIYCSSSDFALPQEIEAVIFKQSPTFMRKNDLLAPKKFRRALTDCIS